MMNLGAPRGRWMWVVGVLAWGLAGCSESGNGTAQQGSGAAGVAQAGAPAAVDGEQIYNRNCYSCHAAGIANAPKTGVAEAWQPRAAKGMAALLAATKEGIPPGMPAMGMCRSCSDEELVAAIEHMLDRSAVEAAP